MDEAVLEMSKLCTKVASYSGGPAGPRRRECGVMNQSNDMFDSEQPHANKHMRTNTCASAGACLQEAGVNAGSGAGIVVLRVGSASAGGGESCA